MVVLIGLLSGCIEDVVRGDISVNNTYTTTGGGGVSFNGDPVNLNGSNMFNGTISNYSTLTYVNDSLNNKVNKSGDNMTGNLNFINSATVFLNDTDYQQTGYFDVFEQYSTSQATFRMIAGRGFNKSASTVLHGKYGNTSVGYVIMVVSIPQTNPTRGLRFRYFPNGSTTPTTFLNSNENDTTLYFGNLTISSLAGSGNDYVCVDPNGKLFRSNAAC